MSSNEDEESVAEEKKDIINRIERFEHNNFTSLGVVVGSGRVSLGGGILKQRTDDKPIK